MARTISGLPNTSNSISAWRRLSLKRSMWMRRSRWSLRALFFPHDTPTIERTIAATAATTT
jgi:hypothetical protein